MARMDEEVQARLEAFEDALDDDNLGVARQLLDGMPAPTDAAGKAVLAYAWAQLCASEDGLDAAEPLLHEVLELDAEHADAHAALAHIAEERGDHVTMVRHNLAVRRFDAQSDRKTGLGTQEQVDLIEAAATRTLAALPADFAQRLRHVPVVLESRPSRDLVESGFDPRALGLFEGPLHGEDEIPAPTRIVLYTCNLLAEFSDPEQLEEEVEVTILHEVGHYFGLEEDDMERLGLD